MHPVLVRVGDERCASAARLPAPWLRPYVAGYGAFRSGTPKNAQHRVLPLNLITVIVDLDGEGPLVFGARALLGAPMCHLTGMSAGLDDVLGQRAKELAEPLAEIGSPASVHGHDAQR